MNIKTRIDRTQGFIQNNSMCQALIFITLCSVIGITIFNSNIFFKIRRNKTWNKEVNQ